jgi:prepilin-type N-terminal cleavage/methylation domain-containing protein
MKQVSTKMRQGQQGFTLVELAIVMIIIGLLIGGILKGQELIANAQISSSVAQVKGMTAGISTFRDSYNVLPGDITDPDVRLPNCADYCNNPGDGDSRIEAGALGVAAADEGTWAFAHMNAADLLTGVDNTGDIAWGAGVPSASVGGGYTMGFSADGVNPTGYVGRAGHYITLQGAPATAASAVISASKAARIDRKMDDGGPGTGSVLSANGATCAVDADTYNEADDEVGCFMAIRFQ